jgi:DUF3102 family protein
MEQRASVSELRARLDFLDSRVNSHADPAIQALIKQTNDDRLSAIANTIREHVHAANAAVRRGLEHAIAAGVLLIEAKGLVIHGEWIPWIEANCEIGPRHAQTYMRLARKRHRLEVLTKANQDSHLTIAAAVALVGSPKDERPHGLPGQLDMLGLPPVPPPSVSVPATSPDHAPFDLIADLEQALAVVRAVVCKFPKRGAQLHATASTITTAIAYLKESLRQRG